MSTSTRRTSAAATVSRDERVAKRPRTPQANSWSARQSASAPAHVLHREAGDEAGADQHTGRRNPEQPSVGRHHRLGQDVAAGQLATETTLPGPPTWRAPSPTPAEPSARRAPGLTGARRADGSAGVGD